MSRKAPQGFDNSRPKWQPKTRLIVSGVSGKWLVQLFLNGSWRTISAHHDYKKEEAIAASQQVQEVFSRYSLEQLKSPSIYHKALNALNYEDDDEAFAIYQDGQWKSDAKTLDLANASISDRLAIDVEVKS
jgi:hypothetical protein